MNKIKKTLFIIFYSLIIANVGWWGNEYYKSKLNASTDPILYIKSRPIEKYQIENLQKAVIPGVEIKIEKELEKNDKFSSYLFSFTFDPTLSGKTKKKVTGLLNLPHQQMDTPDKLPIVILFRGYVDQTIYQTGIGTKRVGEYLAQNGYVTIAPDFLGYGESDVEAENIFESRFQTYTTALTLINSVNSIIQWNQKDLFIWGHSNGGQIALTVLAVTSKEYPTVLWAPVTKPFPYSILFYTDESLDGGKFIRKQLAKFESDYDVDKFSFTNYLNKITAPIQLHQGTTDLEVPINWSESFYFRAKKEDVDINIIKHQNSDHNLNPNWDKAIELTLNFFENYRNINN